MKLNDVKVVYETYEAMKGKKGGYNAHTNTIHILKDCPDRDLVEYHERIHASRRYKFTFQLGVFFIENVLLLMVLTILTSLIQPLFVVVQFCVFTLLGCYLFEEAIAVYKTWVFQKHGT